MRALEGDEMNNTFPQPVQFGATTTRWLVAALLRWEQAISDRPIEIPPEAEQQYIRDYEVAKRYDVSRATVWRWTRESRGEQR